MKGCELCGSPARMYCESDQASLCWDCDEKVHGANFLVAKHCRSLLCQVCQWPTPWKASGPKLGPTVSICESCFSLHNQTLRREDLEESQGGNCDDDDAGDDESLYGGEESDDDDGFCSDDEDEEEEEEEEDGDNQVVPWSGSAASSAAPPVASSSNSTDHEEVSSGGAGAGGVSKRLRDYDTDIDSSEDETGGGCGYGRLISYEEGHQSPYGSSKKARTTSEVEGEGEDGHHRGGQGESRSAAVMNSLKRLQREMVSNAENASATILGICRLSRKDHHSR
ncbi:hypothetical protein Tsubulata_005396 [Turnera subulata]|uniref:B box-type domain-containing protein n=1 Tax=Turnera subulata TaxID=218843 RepID=A0A9Q0JIM6_9ROSI|nr:hypothetical protein Tsubulata_005396 [Turnera subulata]